MIKLDTQQPQKKRRKYNVGRLERIRRRERNLAVEVQEHKALLAQYAEAHQATAHAASLTASVSSQFAKLYTSPSSFFHEPVQFPVPTENTVLSPRTHPSRTDARNNTNPSPQEQEEPEEEEGYLRERSPSDVISIVDQKEEPLRDTPYSPVQSTPRSPLQEPIFPPIEQDEYTFLGARKLQNLEQRISEAEPPHRPSIPRGPSRQYDSYRPRGDRYRPRGRGRGHRRIPRLTREL